MGYISDASKCKKTKKRYKPLGHKEIEIFSLKFISKISSSRRSSYPFSVKNRNTYRKIQKPARRLISILKRKLQLCKIYNIEQ